MLLNGFPGRSLLLMLLTLSLVVAKEQGPNTEEQELTPWQKDFYQSIWPQRARFGDQSDVTRRRGPQPEKPRMVYPCYCYKPQSQEGSTTAAYEKYMIETKDIFILNK